MIGTILEKTVLAVKPLAPSTSGPLLGIKAWLGDTNRTLAHPQPWEQIQTSTGQIISTLEALFQPKGQIGVQQLGGAVMIGRVYYNLFQDEEGFRQVLWFSVILNVNLAMLNLLPLPVLDGGHIVLSLIEAVRRRPVNANLLNYIQNGFAALLIAFMIYIAFFDTGDWIRSAHADRDVPVVFAAPIVGLYRPNTIMVGTVRCAVPVAERSVRRRNNAAITKFYRSIPDGYYPKCL